MNIISMEGIMDSKTKNRNMIKNILKGEPQILHDYASCFTDQKLRTEYRYLLHIKEFLLSINNLVDVDQPETFNNLKVKDVSRYMESVKAKRNGDGEISSEYYNHKRAALWNFFKYLYAEEYVTKNIIDGVPKLKSNTVHEYVYLGMTEDGDITLDSIRDALEETHRKTLMDSGKGVSKWGKIRNIAIIDLILAAGLRVHELVQLDVNSIQFEKNNASHVMIIGKGNKPEIVYFNDGAAESLKAWIKLREELVDDSCQALFIAKGKKRITEKSIENMVKKYTDLTPHQLRATAGMIVYLTSGGNIEEVAKFLRHSNIETTRSNYVTATKGQMIRSSANTGTLWGVAV